MRKPNYGLAKEILRAFSNHVNEFYLGGGTALSMFYYQHRESYDLDFFTKDFKKERIVRLAQSIEKHLGVEVELVGEQTTEKFAKEVHYTVSLSDNQFCGVDFIEDSMEIIKPLVTVDGINVLSLDDIYLRKIFALTGHVLSQDVIGLDLMVGGRQSAKDLYDVYCLSTITMPLSEFADKHGSSTLKEGLIRWFRTYDRMTMNTGLLDIKAVEDPDCRTIEKHFEQQIKKIGDLMAE